MRHTTFGAFVLAAGRSQRAGPEVNKLLVPFEGEPIVVHAVNAAVDSDSSPVIVVLGHEAERVRRTITHSRDEATVRFVENPDYREGMGASIRVAARSLLAEIAGGLPLSGVFVVPGDMPRLRPEHLRVLAEAFLREEPDGQRICVPVHHGKPGHPVLFGRDHLRALAQLRGDRGGRSVLEANEQHLVRVPIADCAIHFDVDHPAVEIVDTEVEDDG